MGLPGSCAPGCHLPYSNAILQDIPGSSLGLLAPLSLTQVPWKIAGVQRLPYLSILHPSCHPKYCLVPAADGDTDSQLWYQSSPGLKGLRLKDRLVPPPSKLNYCPPPSSEGGRRAEEDQGTPTLNVSGLLGRGARSGPCLSHLNPSWTKTTCCHLPVDHAQPRVRTLGPRAGPGLQLAPQVQPSIGLTNPTCELKLPGEQKPAPPQPPGLTLPNPAGTTSRTRTSQSGHQREEARDSF